MSGQDILAIVNVLLVTVLVLVTGFYAWQTRNTVKEMRAAREAQLQPMLSWEFGTVSTGHPLVILRNLGVAPAIGITGVLVERRKAIADREVAIRYQALGPGERIRFYLCSDYPSRTPLTLQEAIAGELRIEARITYRDLLGVVHPAEAFLDGAEYLAALSAASMLWGTTPEDDLLQKLGRVANALEDVIPDAITQSGVGSGR